MRLDEIVHKFPGFYEWKLKALKVVKKSVYRLFLIDKKVAQLHGRISAENDTLRYKYFPNKTVLEIGCGRGGSIAFLENTIGCKCVGVDVSEEMISAARSDNPGPDYQVMDSAYLEFEDKSFDIVLFNYVLHHVENLDKTISEAKRVGKKIVFYESCACKSQPAKILSQLYWRITDGGYRYLTLDEWKKKFQLPVLAEIEGAGLVRYGMCVLGAAEDDSARGLENK